MSRLLRLMFLLSCFAACTVTTTPGNNSTSCVAGQTCQCVTSDDCTLSCPGVGCKFECLGSGDCNFSCPQGGCSVTANASGDATLSCAGNSCTMQCSGSGDCTHDGGCCGLVLVP